MSQGVILTQRDLALLRLLDVTPATAAHIRKASVSFGGEPYRDERRVRERLQALAGAGFVQSFPAAIPAGGSMSYYRLTLEGHRSVHPDAGQAPPRTRFQEVAPSRLKHAMITAAIIVHIIAACWNDGVQVLQILGDGQLTLEYGEYRQQPDFHVQLGHGGATFNLVFEIDNATEPLDSHREQSIRTKILGYESYQDWVLQLWNESGRQGIRPSFRVVFLTPSVERAKHILWLARELAVNKDRRLIYATTQEAFLGEPRASASPILNDHHGGWQALADPHPSSRFLREPIRLSRPVAPIQLV